jgi:alanine dehydrogenase
MNFGVPREAGRQERRVGLTPWLAKQLVMDGHGVMVERDAGKAARFTDQEYQQAGRGSFPSSRKAPEWSPAEPTCITS